MYIPLVESILDMNPVDFEKYALAILSEQVCGLKNCIIQHNKIIEVYDGNYQIDGYIEFEIMGVTYKTLLECKHYKSSIEREKIQVLHGKIQSCGAHKGILISSSNFQSGAIQYASTHGIALIQMADAGSHYAQRGQFNVIMNYPRIPYNYGSPYIGVMLSSNGSGISCSYLDRTNLSLMEYIEKL